VNGWRVLRGVMEKILRECAKENSFAVDRRIESQANGEK
jgi:hypothetical protein